MDLEKKLQFLTGNDEYSAPVKPSHTDKEDDYSSHICSSHMIPVEDDYFDDSLDSLSIDSYLRLDDSSDKKTKKNNRKKEKSRPEVFDAFDDEDEESMVAKDPAFNKLKGTKLYKKITKRMTTDMIDDFESFLDDESNFSDEDSDELRNGLISMGRKYARDTGVSAEQSEITKTFSSSEKRLKDLYDEIARDKVNIQKDIDQLRGMTRGKNYKALSDLNSSKTSYHSTQLQAIKEMNAIKKTEFEMRMKERAAKLASTTGGGDDISTNTIRSLFGAGRNDIINAAGGYSRVSGATGSSIGQSFVSDDMSDDEIEQTYFSNDPEETTDGDKFLEYEGKGVEYTLLVDDDNSPIEVVAKDRDGNVVPDYPMPTNVEQLQFNINMTTQSAEDELHRKYKVERI
nr:MAG TPA: hypothetical protein [Caudoviricetes sp.]